MALLLQILGIMIEKSPLTPLYQRGELSIPLEKGASEGFYNECLYP
jgi:hypothetical protein